MIVTLIAIKTTIAVIAPHWDQDWVLKTFDEDQEDPEENTQSYDPWASSVLHDPADSEDAYPKDNNLPISLIKHLVSQMSPPISVNCVFQHEQNKVSYVSDEQPEE